ncbi:MAG: flavin reductase family protein [Leucobacter sp.]
MRIHSNAIDMPADMPVDLALRRAFSSFPTGVVAVCGTTSDGTRAGMAVNSFTSISLDPPLVAMSVARTSRTWPVLKDSESLGLSVLGSRQEQVSRNLAAREGDRFGGAAWAQGENGAIHLEDAALWLTCGVHSEIDAGDHIIVLLRVDGMHYFQDVEPLVFHQSRYRAIVE